MTKTLQKNILALLVGGIILTILAYFRLDKIIALTTHSWHTSYTAIFKDFTLIERPLYYFALTATLCTMLFANRDSVAQLNKPFVSVGFSVSIAYSITEFLKFIFGRFWPETWTHNNLSLISNNAFGFNFFHGGSGYASFPSGHMTIICAVATVLCIHFPKAKGLWAAFILFMAISLLMLDYHFLSDIIAGSILGTITSLLVDNWLYDSEKLYQGLE